MKTSSVPDNAIEVGKARRKTVTRSGLGEWDPKRRQIDPQRLLEQASIGRVPALLKIKRERMSASPFSFFRGAAAVMAYDLSLSPHTGIVTQLCGDAHVQNLGSYAGIDGKLIFDINDFDETICGPFEWDVKRMITSILLAGQQAGIKDSACHPAASVFLNSYSDLVRHLSGLPVLEVARYQVRRLSAAPSLAKMLAKAERASPLHLLDKLTQKTSSGRIFRSEPPVLTRIRGSEKDAVLASIKLYRESLMPERQHFIDQFQAIDVGFKVVGTGSVGLLDYCVYMQGNGPDDPLFLQIKQEVKSVWAKYLPKDALAETHEGKRVADGQRAMQLQSDPLLGWTRFGGHDFLVRQLNDHKATLDVTTLNAAGLAEYAKLCGEMLARGHARSGNAHHIAGYIGSGKVFATSILEFACAYAEQTVHDWKQMSHNNAKPAKKTAKSN